MKRVTHSGGRRPSFKKGQRKYSVARCGAIVYDNGASAFASARLKRRWRSPPTCKKCQAINAASKAWRREEARKDRVRQLANYRARRERENFMRARFGLKPTKWEPPPPSDYWGDW